MALTTAKLTLYNDKGKELTIEAVNTASTCNAKGFTELMMSLTYSVGVATTEHPGFIDWGKSSDEEASDQE